MPTSATGADRSRGEAGFTLIELLVVLVIVGLMASVVVLTAPRGPDLSAEADRFAARLTRAKEEAVLTNRAIRVKVSPDGYAFRARSDSGWSPLEEGPFRSVRWSDGVVATVSGEEADVSFETTGVAEPLAVTLTRADQSRRISVDAAGNVRIDDAA